MTSPSRKLFWLASCVIGFAVFMTGLLLYFKYQSVYTGLQRDRVRMVAQEIDDIAEKNLSLGQDFWSIATLQDVIERQRDTDTLFTAIEVAGSDGKIAYSTDLSRLGSMLPAEWIESFRRNKQGASFPLSADESIVASSIRNGFDQLAGYAVIRYERTREREALAAFRQRLAITCTIIFAAFTLLLFGLLIWLERRVNRALSSAADTTALSVDHPLAEDMTHIAAQLAEARDALAKIDGTVKLPA
jgi:hypothetical protein